MNGNFIDCRVGRLLVRIAIKNYIYFDLIDLVSENHAKCAYWQWILSWQKWSRRGGHFAL